MPQVRITHMLSSGYRAAELAPGVVLIEGGPVRSMATIARRCVTTDPIESTDTLEATDADIAKANKISESFARAAKAFGPPPLDIASPGTGGRAPTQP